MPAVFDETLELVSWLCVTVYPRLVSIFNCGAANNFGLKYVLLLNRNKNAQWFVVLANKLAQWQQSQHWSKCLDQFLRKWTPKWHSFGRSPSFDWEKLSDLKFEFSHKRDSRSVTEHILVSNVCTTFVFSIWVSCWNKSAWCNWSRFFDKYTEWQGKIWSKYPISKHICFLEIGRALTCKEFIPELYLPCYPRKFYNHRHYKSSFVQPVNHKWNELCLNEKKTPTNYHPPLQDLRPM